MPPPLLLPLMAIGMYSDGILVLLLLLILMGKIVVLLRCIYLYEMLPMLLSPPMPLLLLHLRDMGLTMEHLVGP